MHSHLLLVDQAEAGNKHGGDHHWDALPKRKAYGVSEEGEGVDFRGGALAPA